MSDKNLWSNYQDPKRNMDVIKVPTAPKILSRELEGSGPVSIQNTVSNVVSRNEK